MIRIFTPTYGKLALASLSVHPHRQRFTLTVEDLERPELFEPLPLHDKDVLLVNTLSASVEVGAYIGAALALCMPVILVQCGGPSPLDRLRHDLITRVCGYREAYDLLCLEEGEVKT